MGVCTHDCEYCDDTSENFEHIRISTMSEPEIEELHERRTMTNAEKAEAEVELAKAEAEVELAKAEAEVEKPRPSIVPSGIRKVKLDITKAKILLYGPPKIGKTTLASQFPGAWFFATEQGQDWLEVYEPTVITDWDQFLEICGEIQELQPTHFGDGQEIHTLVFDTGELLFQMCYEYICNQLGVASPADLDWGKGWSALKDEFLRVMSKISRWPYGMVFICHAKEQEVKSKSTKIDRIQPAIMATGFKIIHALCDIILYCFVDEIAEVNDDGEYTGKVLESRMIRCQPQNNVIAGDRTGKLPAVIPMDYEHFSQHFPATPKPKTEHIKGKVKDKDVSGQNKVGSSK
jgi:hypothetical protein